MKEVFVNIARVASYIFIGLMVAAAMYSTYTSVKSEIYMLQPIANVFEAHLVVPNFKIGDDPSVNYTRSIRRELFIRATSQVIEVKSGFPVCVRNDNAYLYPSKPFDTTSLHISYYMQGCMPLKLGQYYISSDLQISIEGLPDRRVTLTSNVFDVMSQSATDNAS